MDPRYIFVTGPGAYSRRRIANYFPPEDDRVLVVNPENGKWDKHVAEFVNKNILDKDGKFLVITQSQIVINQILIRLKNNALKVDDVAIHFMNEDGECVRCDVRQHGRIRKAPSGFFEQYTNDLDALI